MGWDRLTNQPPQHAASKSSSAPTAIPDLQSSEWDR
ncbi:hypothetical protein CASFOL_016551 [Castilleja foliolosa]|uniref:Uncharacterized protein n=1 Tax=Castilleja foliolosa TaxID=1961234 RepID=A0ABD3DBN2_9LAMI